MQFFTDTFSEEPERITPASSDPLERISVLADADLLLTFFMGHNDNALEVEVLLQRFNNQNNIRIYVTDFCLARLSYYLSAPPATLDHQNDAAISWIKRRKIASQLKSFFRDQCLDITHDMLQTARQLSMRDFDTAVEVVCAKTHHMDALITQQDLQLFEGKSLGLKVWPVDQFLVRAGLEKLMGQPRVAINLDQSVQRIQRWLLDGDHPRTVHVLNTPLLIDAIQDSEFAELVSDADLFCPAGKPIVWLAKHCSQGNELIADVDLFRALLQANNQVDSPVNLFLMGDSPRILRQVLNKLDHEFPHLTINTVDYLTCTDPIPKKTVDAIKNSPHSLVLVSMGTTQQTSQFIAHQSHRVKAVTVGVGQAFSVYADDYQTAPIWIQDCWAGWFYRWCQAPRALLKNYHPRYVVLFLWLLLSNQLILRKQLSQWLY